MTGDELDCVEVPIGESLDLHSFLPRDIPSVVEEYLLAAHAAGLSTVRIIHGRGRGVQRQRVHTILAHSPLVAHAEEAPADLGGWGATIVELVAGGDEDGTRES